jgi:DNA (cytosine-5)-methyltransferase 1
VRFGSVCSGIEAASVAWEPLGWQAAWFAEIEPFPSAVLKYHYANVPNLGDMTRLPEMIRAGEVEAPDLFCGGTPCQAFSVAGLRKSLDDARGNLSLTFCEIANAIDHVRSARGELPAIVFWENVPGVLSTADNAFGCFLSALAGCDTAIDPLAATGWTNAGVVAGPQRTVAWRVLDAQYFGLAQRRRRVFVVASARAGFDPASVLLEWDGLRRDSAPSRKAGKSAAACAASGAAFGGNRTSGPIDVAPALNACGTASGRQDFETEAFVTAFHPTQDPISSTDVCHAIGTGNGQGCATAAVALQANSRDEVRIMNGDGQITGALTDEGRVRRGGTTQIATAMQVRRLTPVECERLQGFPDGYTAIPWRNKPASECPDGPRYKALGNSWAVPCVRWIGRRIHNAVVGRPA